MQFDHNIRVSDLQQWKTVRRYTQEAFTAEQMQSILDAVERLTPLDASIENRFVTIEAENVLGQGNADAPMYLSHFSEAKEGWCENAGFLMFQLQLLLSKHGIGSCALSMSRPKVTPAEAEGLSHSCMLSIGMPLGEGHRSDVEQFKRKQLSQINSNEELEDIVACGRLAPSGGNAQPWYFSGDGSRIDIYAELAGDVFNTQNTELKLLDVGMACYALYLGALEKGSFGGFVVDAAHSKGAAPEKGFTYNRTMLIQ